MNVKQSYFDFLQEQGAKEKVQAIIRKGIDDFEDFHVDYLFNVRD